MLHLLHSILPLLVMVVAGVAAEDPYSLLLKRLDSSAKRLYDRLDYTHSNEFTFNLCTIFMPFWQCSIINDSRKKFVKVSLVSGASTVTSRDIII